MESNKLKFATELNKSTLRLLSSDDIDALAAKELVPHFKLINPINQEVRYLYNNQQLLTFLNKNLISDLTEMKFNTVVSFGNSGFSKVEDSYTPKELMPLQNSVYEVDYGVVNAPSGVYFLYNNDELVYIGQSVNVIRRLCDHKTEARKSFNKMYFIKIPKKDLTDTEIKFIRHFKPKYNKTTKAMTEFKSIEDLKHIILN